MTDDCRAYLDTLPACMHGVWTEYAGYMATCQLSTSTISPWIGCCLPLDGNQNGRRRIVLPSFIRSQGRRPEVVVVVATSASRNRQPISERDAQPSDVLQRRTTKGDDLAHNQDTSTLHSAISHLPSDLGRVTSPSHAITFLPAPPQWACRESPPNHLRASTQQPRVNHTRLVYAGPYTRLSQSG